MCEQSKKVKLVHTKHESYASEDEELHNAFLVSFKLN